LSITERTGLPFRFDRLYACTAKARATITVDEVWLSENGQAHGAFSLKMLRQLFNKNTLVSSLEVRSLLG
jgi:hypothetical protein